jgi:radical SAM protein with 4Fe4S-binding SPASM domain
MDNTNKKLPIALIRSKKKVNLGKVAPLEMPFAIGIDLCTYCNLKCKFCFHYKNEVMNQMMDMDLLKKIINDIKIFKQKLKKISIGGFGENLIHPQFIDILKYIIDSEITEYIELFTNGILLTEELCESIADSGLNQINISIEAVTDEGYLDVTGRKVDVNKLASIITYLYNYKKITDKNLLIYIKIIDVGLKNKEEEKLFYDLFENSCDYLFIEKAIDLYHDSGNETIAAISKQENRYGLSLKNNKVCPLLFIAFNIHADGIVTPCCSDWNRTCIIGDIKKESVKDVWDGKLLREIRIAHLNHKKNEIPLCKGCRVYDLNSTDNIDGYEDEILYRMKVDLK